MKTLATTLLIGLCLCAPPIGAQTVEPRPSSGPTPNAAPKALLPNVLRPTLMAQKAADNLR